MNRTLLVPLFLCLLTAIPAAGSEKIPVVNRSGVDIYLWFWRADANRWSRPPLAIGPHETSVVDFSGESYYLVAQTRTQTPNAIVLGWIAPGAMKRRSPSVSLVLSGTTVAKTRKVRYTVMTQQCETRVESVPTTRWYWANGQWHSETEMREERYQVSHCVPEQREMTETYEALGIHASAQDASGQLMSEVTFKTEKPGAFVRYQLATEDEVKIASNPTNTAEIVPVGTYFVWTERNQKSSSLKYHYDIYEKTREITIPETAPVR